VAVGEITNEGALATAFAGADTVFHLVSNFRTASGPAASYRAINVEGTRAALAAARAAGARRFVHCSTIGVHGHVRSTSADEASPYAPGDLYQKTKVEAEALCGEEMKRGGMEIVILRPCSIYGPGDLRMLKMFRMLARGTFFLVGPCRENFHAVYIDDLIDGFLRAMERPGIAGETFILGGPRYLPLKDYVGIAAAAVGAPPPRRRLPYGPLFAASALCEALCRPIGIEPPLHRRRIRFFRNNRAFSIEKARRLLGYEPRVDLEEGMRRTVAWYRKAGLLA
jgi:nucleoside-diphosphate-sugar epimerase